MKQCFKCKEHKELDCFYKHAQMADGHVNKCIECNKKDVAENYFKKHGYYKEYDKARQKEPERRKNKLEYQKVARAKDPEKNRARRFVDRYVMEGRIVKQPCVICGTMETLEAHHPDYSQPLLIEWLCMAHHKEKHKQTKCAEKEVLGT
jgi:hypothetical protein